MAAAHSRRKAPDPGETHASLWKASFPKWLPRKDSNLEFVEAIRGDAGTKQNQGFKDLDFFSDLDDVVTFVETRA